MDHMIIRRVASRDDGMFGAVIWNNLPFAVSIEAPWLGNEPRQSCIPAGRYFCVRCRNSPDYGYKDSPKFGDTFQVMDVVGRSHIVFHWGNTSKDTEGCIILGERFQPVDGRPAVQQSKVAFYEFMQLAGDAPFFKLTVVDPEVVLER